MPVVHSKLACRSCGSVLRPCLHHDGCEPTAWQTGCWSCSTFLVRCPGCTGGDRDFPFEVRRLGDLRCEYGHGFHVEIEQTIERIAVAC